MTLENQITKYMNQSNAHLYLPFVQALAEKKQGADQLRHKRKT